MERKIYIEFYFKENMAEIKVQIPRDLEINLGENSRVDLPKLLERSLREEVRKINERRVILMALNKILENSKLTEKDAVELGNKLKERFREHNE
jgi:hypothetical protein